MSTTPYGESPVVRAFAGTSQRVGWYRYSFANDRWEWSPEVEMIHGYAPGTVNPTTRLVLSHKHPDDYEYVAATLDEIRETHRPFSTRHRIVTVQGITRDVVVIGERLHDNSGELIGTQGFYIDVTATPIERETAFNEAVTELSESRAAIEQAKGMLMMVYRIEARPAFELLRWRSQETNTKLRALAEQLVEDIRALRHAEGTLPLRSAFDRALLTTHQRVRARAARNPS
jgi:PAS domain S-box-containing protein